MKTMKQAPIAVFVLSAMLAGCGGSKDAPPQLQLEAICSGQVFPDTNLGCSAITGDNPALKLCGRLWL